MKTICTSVHLVGDSAILDDAFTEEQQEAVQNGTTKTKRGQSMTNREMALKAAYFDKDGYVYAPGPWLIGTVKGTMHFCKIGKKSASWFTGSIRIPETPVYLMRNGKKIHIDECGVDTRAHNCHQGDKILKRIKHRLMIELPWELDFKLNLVDDGSVTILNVQEFLEKAGYLQGIGSFRPQHKGQFGCFHPTQIEVTSICDSTNQCKIIGIDLPKVEEKKPATRGKKKVAA